MEAIKLSRAIYNEAIEKVESVSKEKAYLDQFEVEFPDGLNTASTMEICRVIQDTSFEGKVHLLRICIAGKNVKVTCPNGEVESFRLGNAEDSFDGIDLFRKDPLALYALSDTVYGYILKKSLRPSMAQAEAEAQETSKE
ncbi:MAG: hypothetical protein IKY09_02800 [Methanocorpusculum sp.]|nr:hypothetical protein [Methanocorpusculum sp.]MBR5450179.1 hypothetical protein [Methanocorpusculum sp.]